MENKLKLALILRGISYNENYTAGDRYIKSVNYKLCIDSFYKNIIKPLSILFDIDIYFITYNSIYNEDLIKDYKPVDYIFLDKNVENKQMSCNNNSKLIGSMLTNIFNKIDKNYYSHFIITRFDLLFYNKITDYILDYSKFNFISYGNEIDDTDDNFYLFPMKYFHAFNICIKKMINLEIISHFIIIVLKQLIGIENISFFFKDGFINNKHKEIYMNKQKGASGYIKIRKEEIYSFSREL